MALQYNYSQNNCTRWTETAYKQKAIYKDKNHGSVSVKEWTGYGELCIWCCMDKVVGTYQAKTMYIYIFRLHCSYRCQRVSCWFSTNFVVYFCTNAIIDTNIEAVYFWVKWAASKMFIACKRLRLSFSNINLRFTYMHTYSPTAIMDIGRPISRMRIAVVNTEKK